MSTKDRIVAVRRGRQLEYVWSYGVPFYGSPHLETAATFTHEGARQVVEWFRTHSVESAFICDVAGNVVPSGARS